MSFDMPTITKGIGALTSAGGDIATGIGESRAYTKNAALDLQEARLQAQERLKQGRQQAGTQTVGLAKSGFAITDSPMMILDETSRNAEADALMLLKSGQLKAAEGKAQSVRSLFSGFGEAFSRAGDFSSKLSTTKKEDTTDLFGGNAPTPVYKPRVIQGGV